MKNVTEMLSQNAKKLADKTAVSFRKRQYSFEELEQRVNQLAHKFMELGVKPHDKVLFFVKPDLNFAAITFALFRLGATTVFIDPGMKREYFLNAIEEVKPDILVGIPKVHLFTKLKPNPFKNIRLFIQTGRIPFLAKSLWWNLKKKAVDFDIYKPKKGDLAAILYTSGGTGAPKGVEYTHDMFINQVKLLKSNFHIGSEDIDIPGFPLFSFFSIMLGLRSHVPDIDVSKPAEANPQKLYEEIKYSKATLLAGSPAIWDRLADYCLERKLKLETVKHIMLFGAPVDIKLHEKFAMILTQGKVHTPYGATECLPVASIASDEILKKYKKQVKSGKGICIGKPVKGVEVKVIKPSDDAISKFEDIEVLPEYAIGEIIVTSKNVTLKYHQNETATHLAKIYEDNRCWHRMGDMGYFDSEGNLWFCGRQQHIVFDGHENFYPTQIEAIFNQHAKVKRSALIQDQHTKEPIVVIQRKDGRKELESMLLMDLKNLAKTNLVTNKIKHFAVVEKLPVDVRHNIKIDRTTLSKQVSI